ncbi:hypothetical protein GF342_00400 [Candidatus Woesearchaeota archaeon]|nr:hypothetical protein [Candidatus Woesearchaeota archaeon]
MRLLSLQLENIRSYVNEKLSFSQGKVLLQGDIGAGKSTVLLAIEFSLFGILRGMLSGNALLRHGTKKGSVTLEFNVNGQHVFIKRSLKASRGTVDQDEGVLIIDGVVHNLTPTELKVRILDLLGYPQDMLTKSKTLIYRYTVYTPQEQMKRILTESAETRINVLRKIFDIDKYKRICDNAQPYLRTLRDKQRNLEGFTKDIVVKQQGLQEKKKDHAHTIASLRDVKAQKDSAFQVVETIKKEVAERERVAKEQQELITKIRLLEEKCVQTSQFSEDLRSRIAVLTQAVSVPLEPHLTEEKLAEQRKKIEEEQKSVEQELTSVRERLTVCSTHISQSEELKQAINNLSQCPTCLQNVSVEHKQNIAERESQKLQRMQDKILSQKEQKEQLEKRCSDIRSALQEMFEKEKAQAQVRAKVAQRQEQEKELLTLKSRLEKFMTLEKDHKNELALLRQRITPGVPEAMQEVKKRLDTALSAFQELHARVAALAQRADLLSQTIDSLDKEIEEKVKAQKKMRYVSQTRDWLSRYFIPLMQDIEKQVLARIYHNFNDLFAEWFAALVDDDLFSARLDDEFTPIIEQNGYETTIDNLSGGERTACALAYRLALTKVINNLITTIKTRDVLILDEPTDGFSSQQLDRLREVLDSLELDQVIIVSHERKIESFADHVVSISKYENVSRLQ